MKAKEFSLLFVTCGDDAILRVLYMRRDRFRSIRADNIADLLIALLPRTDLNCNHVISRTVTIIHCTPVIPWSHSQSYCIFLHILE
eukprot:g14506.t1